MPRRRLTPSDADGQNPGSDEPMDALAETKTPAIHAPSLVPEGFYGACHLVVRGLARALLSLDATAISGREFIPARGGFVLASNHCSHFDPPILAVASPRPLTFFAKRELFANPVFGAVIRRLGAFPVDRGSGDQAALACALDYLRAGHALVIFPEGTRSLDGTLGRAKLGAALMAVKAGVPLVPTFIDGSYRAWRKGGPIRRAPVRVRIGEPILPSGIPDTARGYAALTAEWTRRLIALGAASSMSRDPSTV